MHVYVRRSDTNDCLTVDSSRIHNFCIPIDKYKKYKIKDGNNSTFDAVIVFYNGKWQYFLYVYKLYITLTAKSYP